MIPLYKKGDVVRFTEQFNSKIYPSYPMIILDNPGRTIDKRFIYEVMQGDTKRFYYERCIELVCKLA